MKKNVSNLDTWPQGYKTFACSTERFLFFFLGGGGGGEGGGEYLILQYLFLMNIKYHA